MVSRRSRHDGCEGVSEDTQRRATIIGFVALALVFCAVIALATTARPHPSAVWSTPTVSPRDSPTQSLPQVSTPVAASSGSTPASDVTQQVTALRALVERVERTTGATVGIAVVPVVGVGGTAPAPIDAGTITSGPAWSLAKVPLVLAVDASAGRDAQTDQWARAAITASDNAAADQLYGSLGDAVHASAAVQRELSRHGDPVTQVPAMQRRQGFSVIGQTVWTLADSARFTATLPCSGDATHVLALMGQVEAGQRWGLGHVPAAAGTAPPRFKGGWGPDLKGDYLVRQMGIVDLGGHRWVAVSLAAVASDGAFESGTTVLSAVARGLPQALAGWPVTTC